MRSFETARMWALVMKELSGAVNWKRTKIKRKKGKAGGAKV
jgi:hypothetical protein